MDSCRPAEDAPPLPVNATDHSAVCFGAVLSCRTVQVANNCEREFSGVRCAPSRRCMIRDNADSQLHVDRSLEVQR